MNPGDCRLCGGPLQHRFDGKLLGRHEVAYFACQSCGSLQTERPHWLAEAYSEGNLASLDTGAAQRNLNNLGAVLLVARCLGLRGLLDFGGGDGLLVRMLRDRGVDARVVDQHAEPRYAMGFGGTGDGQPGIVTAFEVVEHFVDPREELRALFAALPAVLMISTDVWEDQGPQWWYLAPETGQHVFFYTRQALTALAAREGYRLTRVGGYWLFIRRAAFPRWRERLVRILLSGKLRSLRNAWAVTRATPGVWRDHEDLAGRLRSAADAGPR